MSRDMKTITISAVVRVPFVYGGHYWVAKSDLDNPDRRYLPLYCRDGRKFEDTVAGQRALRRREATFLVRENIGTPESIA